MKPNKDAAFGAVGRSNHRRHNATKNDAKSPQKRQPLSVGRAKVWRVTVRGEERWCVNEPTRINRGKRRRRFFRTEAEARSHAELSSYYAETPALEFARLSERDQGRVLVSLARLRGDADALEEAVSLFLAHRRISSSITLAELIDELIQVKARANLRPQYLRVLRQHLLSFAAHIGPGAIAHRIGPDMIEDWLDANDWSPATKRGCIIDVRTALSYAASRGYCRENAALKIQLPGLDEKPPGILSVADATALLRAAAATDPRLIPFISVQLFGGLRPSEARALRWEDIKPDHIEIRAARSKSRRRRLVDINPTLRAWLDGGGDLPIRPRTRRLQNVRRVAGIEWPADCLRHSFCSYALPIHGAAKVAAQAGHSESVLFRHYRELVSRDAAESFWRILPIGNDLQIINQGGICKG